MKHFVISSAALRNNAAQSTSEGSEPASLDGSAPLVEAPFVLGASPSGWGLGSPDGLPAVAAIVIISTEALSASAVLLKALVY